jgi:alpha-N-arabinofuranosidase
MKNSHRDLKLSRRQQQRLFVSEALPIGTAVSQAGAPGIRSNRRVGAALLALVTLPGMACAHAQMTQSSSNVPGTIQVHITAPAQEQLLPPTLFGSFLEPIGHSTYGGLWADVVENPSFENGLWSAGNVEAMLKADPELRDASQLGLPLPWRPLYPEQGHRYAPVREDAANSYQSLLLMAMPGKETGIAQTVYLPVHRELSYHGSVWIRHVSGDKAVGISLRRHADPEQTLASAPLDASATGWTRYSFKLSIRPGEVAPLEPVDLVIAMTGDARAQVDNISLDPDDAVDGMDPDEIRMARGLHTPVVRYGGNFTSAYNWRDGTGPLDKRVSKLNIAWGIPEYNTLGTDEFLEFCRLIGAQPQIALNLGTGTPQEAAAWVRYVDAHWGSHQGGLLWELGNELWGDWQVGYPTLDELAARTLANSRAVRAVDPDARLIATGADEEHFQGWNAQQLTDPSGTFNYLSTHFVVTDNVDLPDASDTFRTMASLALPWGLGPRMHAIQQQAAAAGQPKVKVAFTEWLMISHDHAGPDFTNMGGALFAGGFLNMVMRDSDVVSISDMTGIMEFGGIWKRRGHVYGAPAYWVLRTYASAQPHYLLSVQSDSPTYSIQQGITRLPEIADTPYLDIIAAENKDRSSLLLFCVNRDLTRSLTAHLDLGSLSTAGSQATVTTLTAENILAENDEQDPERVAPVTRTVPLNDARNHAFPNASVTVIEIPLKGRN